MAVAAAAAQEEPDRETGGSATTAAPQNGLWLLHHGTGNDDALIEWLQGQDTQPRCRSLLQQVLGPVQFVARFAGSVFVGTSELLPIRQALLRSLMRCNDADLAPQLQRYRFLM